MSAEMTIILLNYKRPENIPIILDSIDRQTVKPIVFLWNNGPDDVDFSGIDRYKKSPDNAGCMVRWNFAREADTPYIMSLDDDFCFGRDDALADVIESLRAMDDPARIVGPTGCSFADADGPLYTKRRDVYARYVRSNTEKQGDVKTGHTVVDMVKGRSMAFRRDRLEGLRLPEEREDDIFLSAALAGGRRLFHRVPKRLDYAFRELPELGVANWKKPDHFDSRDRAAAKYFGPSDTSLRPHPQKIRTEEALDSPDLACSSWRPNRLGTVHKRDGKQLLLRLDSRHEAAQLNPTAAMIWELCNGARTQAEILAALSKLYAVPENILWPDLRGALESLVNIGALEPAGKPVVHPHSGVTNGVRIRLGLVAETRPGFLNQVKLCLFSLRKNGGVLRHLPVTLITNSQPLSDRDAGFLTEHFSPIEFKTSPRLGAIPHTSKLNVFYSIDPSTYDILMFMDCDTVVRKPLDHIADPIMKHEGVQFICRRGGETDRNRFVDFDALVSRFCGQGRTNQIDFEGQPEWPMFNSGVFLATSEAVSKIRRNSIDFTYQLFNEWQRNNTLERLPEHIKQQIEFTQEILANWPIEQGALALACIKSGVKVQYLEGTYNTWGGEEDFHILHCFKSLYTFNRIEMFREESEEWIAEYLESDIPGKIFLASIVREYKQNFPGDDSR
ncbi:MAG: PqqD family peptide modification chaperone [bacterium]|nr:PqqD family peptide modification chaperone [bacterium]